MGVERGDGIAVISIHENEGAWLHFGDAITTGTFFSSSRSPCSHGLDGKTGRPQICSSISEQFHRLEATLSALLRIMYVLQMPLVSLYSNEMYIAQLIEVLRQLEGLTRHDSTAILPDIDVYQHIDAQLCLTHRLIQFLGTDFTIHHYFDT